RDRSAAGSRRSASPGRDGRTRQTLVSPPGIGATPIYRPRRTCISPKIAGDRPGDRPGTDPVCKVLVIGADGPAAGAARVTRQAEAERDRGVTPVGGDGDPRGERLAPAVRADRDPGHRAPGLAFVDDRAARADP